jgi:SAM-dependent methyltransferase
MEGAPGSASDEGSPPPGDATYDAVASAYARLTRKWSPPVAAALVRRASVSDGDHVLDVGTGTGIAALEAAARVGTGGLVLGIDVSEAMLAEARAAAAEAGASGVSFAEMAAEALDVPDRDFDVVLSLFAVPHLRDPGAALREMHRVLRPGGRLVLGVGGGAPLLSRAGLGSRVSRVLSLVEARGRSLVAPGFLEGLLPLDGAGAARERPHIGLRALVALVQSAGFERVVSSWSGHETEVESPDEFWELQATFSTPVRTWLAAADAQAAAALRERFRDECTRVLARGGRLLYPRGAVIVGARRPLENA